MTKDNLPLNPNVELFRWGPAPLLFFYQADFDIMVGGGYYQKVYPEYMWPKSLALHKEGKICWLNEFPALRIIGAKAFVELMLNDKQREKVRASYLKEIEYVNKIKKDIDALDLKKIDDKTLMDIWQKMHLACVNAIVYGLIPELCNYGSDEYLKNKLKQYIKTEQEILKAMEVLTAPEELSFYQKEEIELSETNNLKEHTKKYYWLQNAYSGVKVLGEDFFEKRKKELSGGLRKELENHIADVKKRKKDIQVKYGLSEELMKIAHYVPYGIVWQDGRKEQILRYLHYKELLLNELVRRFRLVKEEILNFSYTEIAEMVNGKDMNNEIKERKRGFGIIITDKLEFFSHELNDYYWDVYAEEKADEGATEVRGIVASRSKNGILRGKVKILLDPYKTDLLEEGDILVAPMTSPEYIFAMRKASAIITDSGGLTSHAAIVSRELKKPCIVNTKVATKVFKDGDLVEIDTDKGSVKVVKRAA